MVSVPASVWMSVSGRTFPVSSAAEIVNGFIVEPGSNVSVSARLRNGIVLSGGASLGAVQVGMVRALYERGIVPDLMTVAKGLTSGYAPMGAVLLAEDLGVITPPVDAMRLVAGDKAALFIALVVCSDTGGMADLVEDGGPGRGVQPLVLIDRLGSDVDQLAEAADAILLAKRITARGGLARGRLPDRDGDAAADLRRQPDRLPAAHAGLERAPARHCTWR